MSDTALTIGYIVCFSIAGLIFIIMYGYAVKLMWELIKRQIKKGQD